MWVEMEEKVGVRAGNFLLRRNVSGQLVMFDPEGKKKMAKPG